MRIFALLASLFVCSVSVDAQIRESVVIVQPTLGEEAVEMYHSIASDFRDRGLDDLADYFDRLTEGGFGTGYITSALQGRSVVVTNRHVVDFADSVSLIVSDKSGTQETFEGCRVIYEDENVDFAMILPPIQAFSDARRLELAESAPEDGTTVWSAGYPGLLGNPSWQLAKGVVTNRHVVVDSLGLPEHAVYIQHSAPIDPGNSGGPLLAGDPSDPSSIRVVGMNTWTVFGRQSANFALSLDMLREAFKRVEKAGFSPQFSDAVRDKAEKLVATINSFMWNRFDSRQYISSRMVALQGWEVFKSLLPTLSKDMAELWIQSFFQESPEETLRQAIYYRMFYALWDVRRPVVLESVEELRGETGEIYIRTKLRAGRRVYTVDWIEEASNWRISQAGIPSAGISGPRPRRARN